jgi:site-specific DNA-methyltransferase (adenine-specific)
VGIDIAIRAIDVIKDRLDRAFPEGRVWEEHGEPTDIDGAAHLAETNAYDFQWWAVRRLGGQPPKGEKKKGGDGGIDGEMVLRDFNGDARRRVIVSVKGGRTLTPDMVKALKSTVDLEKADYGILVTMHEPSRGMRDVARDFGSVPWATPQDGKLGHRIRIVTAAEILAGTVQLPGRNETPRSRSAPPPPEPRQGENLNIPFPSQASARRGPTKARVRNPGPARPPTPPPPASSHSVAQAGRKKR